MLGLLELNRLRSGSDSARDLQLALDSVDHLAEAVRVGEDLIADLGVAHFFVGREHESEEDLFLALASYRSSTELLGHAVFQADRNDLADELAQSLDHESTLALALEGSHAGRAAAERSVEAWERLVELEGEVDWGANLALALNRLGNAESDAGDHHTALRLFERAAEILDRVSSDSADSANLRHTMAMRHQSTAIALRRSGRPDEAIESYRQALQALGDLDDPQSLSWRTLVLDNLGNALGDMELFDDAAVVVDESIRISRELIDGGLARWSDLASACQHRVNTDIKRGRYEDAAHVAREAVQTFDDLLIARGRIDLRESCARLRAALAFAIQGTFDLEAAVLAFDEAVAEFRQLPNAAVPAGVMETLEARASELRIALTCTEADVPQLLAHAEKDLERAVQVAEHHDASAALSLLEFTLPPLLQVSNDHPSIESYDVVGRICLAVGVFASERRPELARRRFVLAIEAYSAVVGFPDGGPFVEPLAHAYTGLVGVLAGAGQIDDARDVLASMSDHVGTIDPHVRLAWTDRAQGLLDEAVAMGAGRTRPAR